MSNKKTLSESKSPTFNSKILIWGGPGTGKTTLSGSYTMGPTHFYCFDPQGMEVLRNEGRTDITVDEYSNLLQGRTNVFPAFWNGVKQDEKDGFFQEMADKEGIVVFDSYTTLENYMVDYVMAHILGKKQSKDGVFLPENKDFRSVTGYALTFFSWATSLPCPVILVVHRKGFYHQKEEVTYWTPSIVGQQGEGAMRWFSDNFYCYMQAGSQFLQVKGVPTAPSASRLIPKSVDIRKLKNPTIDDLYQAYHQGPQILKQKTVKE